MADGNVVDSINPTYVVYRIRQKFRQEKFFTNFASGCQWRKFFRRIFSPTEFRHAEFFVRVQLLTRVRELTC